MLWLLPTCDQDKFVCKGRLVQHRLMLLSNPPTEQATTGLRLRFHQYTDRVLPSLAAQVWNSDKKPAVTMPADSV